MEFSGTPVSSHRPFTGFLLSIVKPPNSLKGKRLLPAAFLAFIGSLAMILMFPKGKMQQQAKTVKHFLPFQAVLKETPLGCLLFRARGTKSLLQLKQSSDFTETRVTSRLCRGKHCCPWKICTKLLCPAGGEGPWDCWAQQPAQGETSPNKCVRQVGQIPLLEEAEGTGGLEYIRKRSGL